MKVVDILSPFGGMSHTDDLMLFGIPTHRERTEGERSGEKRTRHSSGRGSSGVGTALSSATGSGLDSEPQLRVSLRIACGRSFIVLRVCC